MAVTNIEYGDRTWNPLTGCTKVSEGCKHCWAEGMARRLKAMGRAEYQDAVGEKGHWTGKITLVPERLNEPLTWRKPQHVLVEYMGDLFHEAVDPLYIGRVFNVVGNTPMHTYQFLTKRPDRMYDLLSVYQDIALHGKPLPNVLLGCTVESQKRADDRLPAMRALAADGWRTWVSYEPALGAVKWDGWEVLSQLVAGGESGKDARPMHPDWARAARDWCVRRDIPFFFKQWGSWVPVCDLYDDDVVDKAFEYCDHWTAQMEPTGYIPVMTAPIDVNDEGWHEFQPCPGSWVMANVGKKAAGRVLDGREWSGMPV